MSATERFLRGMIEKCGVGCYYCAFGLKSGGCDPRITDRLSGSLTAEGFHKNYFYTIVKVSRSASPIFLFIDGYSSGTIMSMGGICI
jgi:hypothetical protein